MPANLPEKELYRAIFANVLNARAQDPVRQQTFDRAKYITMITDEYEISGERAERLWTLATMAMNPTTQATVYLIRNDRGITKYQVSSGAVNLEKGETLVKRMAAVFSDGTIKFYTDLAKLNYDQRDVLQTSLEEAMAMVGLFMLGSLRSKFTIHPFRKH